MSRPRIYTASDGYTTGDLLHFACDHVAAAQHLLATGNPKYFDSAGYVAHIALELMLKAYHLYYFERFERTHDLVLLYSELIKEEKIASLSDGELQTLHLLDRFADLRYPNPSNPVEVGDDDLSRINKLAKAVWTRMPRALHESFKGQQWFAKGGRVLMEKPIAQA